MMRQVQGLFTGNVSKLLRERLQAGYYEWDQSFFFFCFYLLLHLFVSFAFFLLLFLYTCV